MISMDPHLQYTCRDYREEMMLVKLRQRLTKENLSEEERKKVEKAEARLKRQMGLD